jgi:acetylornithine deacetylase/succinyl-diaminopimelate desuccinylase-like protein
MNLIPLTKDLIKIPSYYDGSTNEKAVADYIFSYLKQNTRLIIEKEIVEGERYNIVAYSPTCKSADGSFNLDTLFINHIDTVEPKQGSARDQFAAIEENGKIYGLGSVDTKGNVAILMKLAELVKEQKCMFLFYVDEEYDFKGIKKFIDNYKRTLTVTKIISADGENLQIRNASRGIYEIDITCIGKTGHASNPQNGVNAIRAFEKICTSVEAQLDNKPDADLGKTTLNVSYIHGGLHKGVKNNHVELGKSGNNIADYLEATLEFRLNTSVNGTYIVSLLEQFSKEHNVNLKIKTVRHNLESWYTDKENLLFLEQALQKTEVVPTYTDAGLSGYVDIGLLKEVFPSICSCIGAKGKNRHGVNEYVETDSLYKLFDIFKLLI